MTYLGAQVDPADRERLAERFRQIDGPMLRALTEAGLAWLRTNQQLVNALNVFPVPDGDTGTNMTLTMQAALEAVAGSDETSVGRMAKAIAHGALMGARGNSGVILSQLWRGLARGLDDLATMDAPALAHALDAARETAYKGVVQPVEGTILTVAKDLARAALQVAATPQATILDVLEAVVLEADESVERTPQLLPVLREAGVVDSGGKGLFFIWEGMLRTVYGLALNEPLLEVKPISQLQLEQTAEAIEPGQDWEVIVDFQPTAELDIPSFYRQLGEMGTSIQVGEGDGLYRMHIHVLDRTEFRPVEYVRTLGTITNVRIENLMLQVPGKSAAPSKPPLRLATPSPSQIAVIVVSPGEGLSRVFGSLGAAGVVDGGQTMNPSTQQILQAVEQAPTDKVIVLPNNKNIVLSARQAIELTGKKLAVVPSHTGPQGIAAMLALDPDGDLATVAAAMESCMQSVRTVEVTMATRTAKVDGVQVTAGQAIGLLDDTLVAAGDDLGDVLQATFEKAGAERAELATLYYGEAIPLPEVNRWAEQLVSRWPGLQVEIHDGGQPHYPIIASVE
jgi:hypothetical protein